MRPASSAIRSARKLEFGLQTLGPFAEKPAFLIELGSTPVGGSRVRSCGRHPIARHWFVRLGRGLRTLGSRLDRSLDRALAIGRSVGVVDLLTLRPDEPGLLEKSIQLCFLALCPERQEPTQPISASEWLA